MISQHCCEKEGAVSPEVRSLDKCINAALSVQQLSRAADQLALENSRGKGSDWAVDFDNETDLENPLNWSKRRKWGIVVLMSAVTLIANLATVMCIPATPQILRDFDTSNSLYAIILVSVWELGEAVGPLITAPLSEIIGRLPVYNAANLIFIVFSVACAVSSNPGMLIAFRFINGMGDASIPLNASIVGDLFVQEERGLAIAISGFPPLIGPVAGPVIGGYLGQAAGWRWTFWLSAITGGVCELGFLLFFRETYKPAILRRRARRMRKDTGNPELRCRYDHDVDVHWSTILRRALIRPASMLVKSPIVLLLAIYISVVYGFLFLLLTTITEVFEGTYHFSQGAAGLSYLGLSVGMVMGVVVCALTLDRLLKRKLQHSPAAPQPEARLPPMVLGALLIPIGLFLYGWTAQYHIHYIVPIIGTATVGFGFFVTTIPLQAYLVDAYKLHAASAIAATIVSRCVIGAVLPLAGPPLYKGLGLGWGNSVLAFVAVGFLPMPFLLMKYGSWIRGTSKVKIAD